MAQSKKTLSYHETFVTSQTDTSVISPGSGDYLFIWNVIVAADGAYELKFASSGTVLKGNGGVTGATGINKQGNDDEDLLLTCDENTTVRVLFDEI